VLHLQLHQAVPQHAQHHAQVRHAEVVLRLEADEVAIVCARARPPQVSQGLVNLFKLCICQALRRMRLGHKMVRITCAASCCTAARQAAQALGLARACPRRPSAMQRRPGT